MALTTAGLVLACALGGAAVSSLLSCVPGLHVYNVMAAALLVLHAAGAADTAAPCVVVPLAAGMVVGFAMLNTVPAVLLAAPDESALFTVLPGQKLLMQGRGAEGVFVTAAGGLAGLLALVAAAPLAPRVLPLATAVLQPHLPWMVWCVIAFMLLSEWPKGGTSGQGGWARFRAGTASTAAGLLTFVASGLLGFVLMYRSPISANVAFQNLMPAFVGLFAVPSLLLNVASRVAIPAQRGVGAGALRAGVLLRGAVTGCLGGAFAAFLPAVTGGVGGLLAGHATAVRDDRVFLVSQGAAKVVYYAGAFLLFFVPGVHLTRGGAAWMLRGACAPHTYADYYMAVASVALGGAASALLLGPLTRLTLAAMRRAGYRRLSVAALGVMVLLVAVVAGWKGLLVLLTATGIGLLPVLLGSRRMNALGIILLPVACNLSDVGAGVARALGLL